MSLPYNGSTSSSTAAVHVVNSGAGIGIQVQSSGPSFNGAALQAANTIDGGLAIYAYGISPSGTTALITNDSQTGGDIVQLWNQGGIRFHVDTGGNVSTVGAINATGATISAPGTGPAITASGSLFGIKGSATGNSGGGIVGVGAGTSFGVVGNSANADGVRGLSTTGNAVHGMSTGLNGVQGETTASGASGVYGQNSSVGGYGVYGRNTAGGYGMGTDGNAFQSRSMGGWAKAMAVVIPVGAGGTGGHTIVRCYNSQLPANQATTPPCGFTEGEPVTGEVTIDFGFEVDDRFVVATGSGNETVIAECYVGELFCPATTANQIGFLTRNVETENWVDVKFTLIVF